ncbi:type II toxin-antitoxin system PemK/MazF family toxin [Caminibacter pacificus]|jgi:mRNA interferase MazF|uniref:Type II toxin-antitoxin system PemK/MazF family toxin n=1 Tax=Caminibacter pacificus TaxID=1424653 RepID=A0AAJ4RCK5_9BACT|nr:type II toxin-antitoxin system PemK/MazF family toxin [Caminibacter pacificus]NPA87921.1 type II toxin-antitoxin system PemK/MazF family toxin [Campylobacterota bacterium]QCI27719.1 type II toxin-antitoxin system PemK/MazF family toxin [Caminibacter pacificus]ROR40105.1 mRNA interferase MazF [Caminibacter pacificus]
MDFQEWLKKNELSLKCKPRTQRASYIEFFEGEFKGDKIPEFKRGEVYFAKLTDSAKTRPFLIYQNDYLNRACYEGLYHTVVVLPLSGQILGGDYRVLIKKRDNMTRDSEIVATAIGIISTGKIIFSKGLVTKLTQEELQKVDSAVKKVLGMENAI